MKPEIKAALGRYESALEDAWHVIVTAADYLRDPGLAAETHAFHKMPHTRAVMEAVAGKERLQSIERALGDTTLRAALEAAPDPEEVALLRAVAEAVMRRLELGCKNVTAFPSTVCIDCADSNLCHNYAAWQEKNR